MPAVAVLGAGAGGAAAAADLGARGWSVRLWHPRPARLEAFAQAGAVACEGALGSQSVDIELVTDRLELALDGALAALVCLPAVALDAVISALAACRAEVPIVLDPGHTGGALRMRRGLAHAGLAPPVAALSTLTYVARSHRPGTVTVGGVADRVRVAALPGGETALAAAVELFPRLQPEPDVLAVDLANTNLVLHPPGAICGAAWIEATGGDYRFYGDGMTPGVIRVLEALDAERLKVALAYGHRLPRLAEEMAAIGTADALRAAAGDTRAAITDAKANAAIRAPDSLAHRYYTEDLAYGLVPFLAYAAACGVEAPTAAALLRIGEVLVGRPLAAQGLTAERLGIEGLDAGGVLRLVRG